MSIKSINSYLFFVIILVILISLGIWQVKRLNEKDHYIESILRASESEPNKIENLSNITTYEHLSFSGEILPENIMWLYRRHPLAKYKDGAYLVAPIRLTNGEEITGVLGWFENSTFKSVETELSNNSKIAITGLIVPSERTSVFIPKNDYNKRIIFTMDIIDISRQAHIKPQDFFIAVNNLNSAITAQFLPISPNQMIKIRNDHMEYAATWFSLAFAWGFIFFVYIRKKL